MSQCCVEVIIEHKVSNRWKLFHLHSLNCQILLSKVVFKHGIQFRHIAVKGTKTDIAIQVYKHQNRKEQIWLYEEQREPQLNTPNHNSKIPRRSVHKEKLWVIVCQCSNAKELLRLQVFLEDYKSAQRIKPSSLSFQCMLSTMQCYKYLSLNHRLCDQSDHVNTWSFIGYSVGWHQGIEHDVSFYRETIEWE